MALRELRVDGGMARSDFLLAFQADMLATEVVRPAITETTALGAAYAAGLAAGVWAGTGELRGLWREDRRWASRMQHADRERLMAGWHRAVQHAFDA